MGTRLRIAWQVFWAVLGGFLLVVSVAGIPDDLKTWETWITKAMNLVEPTVLRAVLAIFGLLIVAVGAVGPQRWEEWFHAVLKRWPWAKQLWEQWHQSVSPVAAAAAVTVPASPQSTPNSDQQLIHALQCDVQQARDRQRSLQQELQVANSTIATLKAAEKDEKQAASTRAAEIRKEGERAARLAKLADMKALIREQIDSAPKDYSLQSVEPWCAGTNHLLASMRLHQLPNHIHHYVQDDEGRRFHQLNIAHLRALFLKVGEGDVDYL